MARDRNQSGGRQSRRARRVLVVAFGISLAAWATMTTYGLVKRGFRSSRKTASGEGGGIESFVNKSLSGTFTSTNAKLGQWKISPSACLDGREAGFQGIVFSFPIGSPVDEIRLDDARQGDNVVEVRLADRAGTVYRVRERECKVIDGSTEKWILTLNGQPMARLVGHIRFDCPSQGLTGEAAYDGCIPQTLR